MAVSKVEGSARSVATSVYVVVSVGATVMLPTGSTGAPSSVTLAPLADHASTLSPPASMPSGDAVNDVSRNPASTSTTSGWRSNIVAAFSRIRGQLTTPSAFVG